MAIYELSGVRPVLGRDVFVAESASVIGDVHLGDEASVWFGAVLRGDYFPIRVGARTNVQDGAVLHVAHHTHPLVIGAGVVIGHQAVVHGCTIEDGALIGIGARVLDGAVIERGAQVGAGAVVAPGRRVPAGHLALGVPARVVRPLTELEARRIVETCERYVALKDEYRARLGPP